MRNTLLILLLLPSLLFFCSIRPKKQVNTNNETVKSQISDRFKTLTGFDRIIYDSNSFPYFLQHLPLKPEDSKVYLFNGREKSNQTVHAAVLDISVGDRDLQQCADAVMRLRADYLYDKNKFEEISFNFVSDGAPRYFTDCCNDWHSLACYSKYLNYIFSYANTRSLKGQLTKVSTFNEINTGDVLIQTGNPYGHAVIVIDMAVNKNTGEKIFMLAQSYMPAQDIHILKNLSDRSISPWYRIPPENKISTPEWMFYKRDLYRFN